MNPVFRFVLIHSTLMSLLGGIAYPAADSWSKKPYTEWTEDECLKILSDSPWSKKVFRVPGTAAGGVDSGRSRLTKGSGAPGAPCNSCAQAASTAAEDSAYAAGGGESTPAPVSMAPCCQVVWFSSLHVRQAIYRLRLLNGETPDPRVEASLQRPVADILIAVSSPSLSRFQSATSASLKSSTFLRSQKKKTKQMQLVDFISPMSRQDRLAIFVFARSLDGQPAFNESDRGAEFCTGEGPDRIRVNFDLRKMKTGGTLDF